MITVKDIFDIQYGHSLELNRLTQTSEQSGIPFVSRVSGKNGISAYVEPIDNIEPSPANQLTCALGGNGVMSVFLQKTSFYSGRDIACLAPKTDLTELQLLFYCYCLNKNKFRYNYGRQANKTLKDLPIPEIKDIPDWVYQTELVDFKNAARSASSVKMDIDTKKWKLFRYDEIFEIKKGYYNKKPPVSNNQKDIPFIGATEKNNGITSHISKENLQLYSKDGSIHPDEPINRKIFPKECITISNNGSVGEAFYQLFPFTCSHDINPIYLKDKKIKLTPLLGLFLATVIRADKYRWNYGRKWRPIRMPHSLIKLPVTENGEPDWEYMENYIKTLPYSSQI